MINEVSNIEKLIIVQYLKNSVNAAMSIFSPLIWLMNLQYKKVYAKVPR